MFILPKKESELMGREAQVMWPKQYRQDFKKPTTGKTRLHLIDSPPKSSNHLPTIKSFFLMGYRCDRVGQTLDWGPEGPGTCLE